MMNFKNKLMALVLLSSSASLLSFSPSDFSLTELNQVDTKTTFDKTLVLVWASWCKNCKKKIGKTIPAIANRNFNVVTVSADNSIKKAKKWIDKNKIIYQSYIDSEKRLKKELKLFSVPAWAVYEKDASGKWTLVKAENAFEKENVNNALGGEFF